MANEGAQIGAEVRVTKQLFQFERRYTMNRGRIHRLTLIIALVVVGWRIAVARAQNPQPQPAADSQAAARQAVLQSDEWWRTQRMLDDWLAVQQIYSQQEIAAIKAENSARTARMSPKELQDWMKELQAKLTVLNSPEAAEARDWFAQHLAVVRNPDEQRRRMRPDVANMSASEIRQELQRFQHRRAETQQSQAAFSQARQMQVQNARDVQASRQQATTQNQSRSAATHREFRSPYAPNPIPTIIPENPPPFYDVSPWGAPIRWHPFADEHRWRW
jgi:hypothetical protein